MKTKTWTYCSCWDTGNGAIVHRYTSAKWDGIEKFEFRSYCGREKDSTWYKAINDPQELRFRTPAKAAERYQDCRRLAAASVERGEPQY